MILSENEKQFYLTEIERLKSEVHFWESNCKAQGRDFKRAQERIKELGGGFFC